MCLSACLARPAALFALLLLAAAASRGQTVYVAGSGAQLATANPVTGSLSGVGTLRDSVTGAPIVVSGLAFGGVNNSGPLYGVVGVDGGDDSLWTFNPATGLTTDLRRIGVSLASIAARPSDGVLFGYANDDPNGGTARLYRYDPVSGGAPSLLGSMGFLTFGALSFDGSNRLFAADSLTGDLYRLDTGTGAASLVGATGIPDLLGMAYTGSTLYGFSSGTAGRNVYSLNLNTGQATFVSSYGFGSGAPLDVVYAAAARGSAPVAVPEAGTTALSFAPAIGIAAAGVTRRRRRRIASSR
jgi:hypothetical protein